MHIERKISSNSVDPGDIGASPNQVNILVRQITSESNEDHNCGYPTSIYNEEIVKTNTH